MPSPNQTRPPQGEPIPETGLILRAGVMGESDVRLDLFTHGLGRLSVVAKGGKRSQKRFFGLLLSGHLLKVNLAPSKKGGDLWRLDSAELIRAHAGLRWDYSRLLAAAPVWELLLRATAPHDPQPRALELALITLGRMEAATSRPELGSALVVFLVRLLDELGYGLSLEICPRCGRPAAGDRICRLALSGGVICTDCARGGAGEMEAPAGILKGFAAAGSLALANLGRLAFAESLLRPGLSFLTRFWQQVAAHDLPALELAARELSRRG